MLKAIETRAFGCRFRSRLEARWSCFYRSLGIPWEYEKEGFELPSGRYLPDFWLPSIDSWIEIKGVAPTRTEMQLALELSKASGKKVYIFAGSIELPTEFAMPFVPSADMFEPEYEWDAPYIWCQCPHCGAFGIEFEGRSDRLPCKRTGCRRSEHGDRGYTWDSKDLLRAYVRARSARFEHGESGAA